ncbi:hypothetical protein JVU11DRAFT_6827 [Chiua virens]|nr:hypothetical protein JVU11DRAFT_6827 [Chiua virens]
MKFLDKVLNYAERLPEGIERARDQVIDRHDSPQEKMNDEIRAKINASHRFGSFAGQREQNAIKWHIDGQDYFWAVSEILDSAKDVIFILDWWLTPEVYLRRPPAQNEEWRLDRLLQRKAQQGVKIYVVVYKEVTQTMTMGSKHTKAALEALHPNIACMRHPDHIGAKDTVEFWSHHEKVVVVDNHQACIGGLDLCFGRWDTHNHPLADAHPTDFARTLFPGQDYNNARSLDFQDVQDYVSNGVSILEMPRMPWHDVHMTICGSVVLDLCQHFVERWNEIKRRKYRDDDRFDWLALPHNVQVAPAEAVARHPHREQWHQVGRRFRQRFHLDFGDSVEPPYPPPPHGTCHVQAVRSVSDWSHGVLTEHSIQNAYIQLIREANHFIYIGRFRISNTQDEGVVKNHIAKALVERIIEAARAGKKFKVVVVIPEVPGFAGDIKNETAIKTIMAAQYRTINRGGHSIYEEIRKAGYEPMDYIRFFHLRSYDRINAPMSTLIAQMEENSGVTFHEAQIALARQWVGKNFYGKDVPHEVYIKIPQEAKAGITVTEEKSAVKKEKVSLPESVEAARQVIARFESGARNLRSDERVADSVSHHALQGRKSLLDETWLGSEEEELNCYVSELLYIHSKVMIVDDRRVIVSVSFVLCGDGDSEIALVVEDDDMIQTTMDGRPYMAARFAATLRRKLFREHLGLIEPQRTTHRPDSFMQPAPTPNDDETHLPEDIAVADPLSDAQLELLNNTARKNREVFTELFRPVPTNLVRSWSAYDNYVPKVKTGHVVPGVPLQRVKERLSQVKGSLVECPLDFLIDDKEFVEGIDWIGLNPTLPVYI